MKRLAFEMEEVLHEDGSFVPGFVIPFMRGAFWRWVKFPDDFNVKIARNLQEHFLFWVDDAVREETMASKRAGERLEVFDRVFDQYRDDQDRNE